MKKITFLITLLIMPIIAIGQTFDFNGTDDGFTPAGSCTLTTNPTFLGVDLTGGGTNPAFGTATAEVNAGSNPFAGVTIKNSDPAGPTLMRISYPKAGGRIYVNLDITAGDTDYKTYWFDLSNADWAGTENDVKVHFKDAGNTTYTIPTAGVTLEIDKIQFVDIVPREEKLVYEFNTDGDDEGFSTLVDATTTVTGGSITITPSAPGTNIAKVTNNLNSVNATTNSHMHIVYQNLSSDNNQLRLQFRSSLDNYDEFIGTNTSINQNMTSFETISLDLATLKPTEWFGLAQDIQLNIRNTNNTGNSSSAGNFVIDRIVFNNNTTLDIDDVNTTTFNISPNPANDIIKVTATSDIESVRIFDITGKLMSKGGVSVSNEINVAILNAGVYFINITFVNGNQLSKKIIKN